MRVRSAIAATCSSVELGLLGDLLVGRVAPELGRERAARALDLALALGDVRRHADRARLVLDPALDRLADPVRRVGRELEAAPPVELLGRADEAEDALLDEVSSGSSFCGYFLAIETTSARLELIIRSLATGSPCSMRLESSTSSAAVSSGWRRISLRNRPSASVVATARPPLLKSVAGTLLRPQSSVTSMPRSSKASCSSCRSSSSTSRRRAIWSSSERLTQPDSSPLSSRRASGAGGSSRSSSMLVQYPVGRRRGTRGSVRAVVLALLADRSSPWTWRAWPAGARGRGSARHARVLGGSTSPGPAPARPGRRPRGRASSTGARRRASRTMTKAIARARARRRRR